MTAPIGRAERAEAALAALQYAAASLVGACRAQFGDVDEGDAVDVARFALRDAIADTAAAAEAYTRRVRAEGEDAARQTALDALRAWRADGNRNAPIYGPATHILDALRVDTFYEKLLKRSATTRTDDEAPAHGDRAR